MKRTVFLLSIFALLSQGCYNDNIEELYAFEDQVSNANCDVENVTFNGTINPMIQGNCAIGGCHVSGGSGPGIYENYGAILEPVNSGKMMERVINQKTMPPTSPLTSCQIAQLQAWIDAGAPNN